MSEPREGDAPTSDNRRSMAGVPPTQSLNTPLGPEVKVPKKRGRKPKPKPSVEDQGDGASTSTVPVARQHKAEDAKDGGSGEMDESSMGADGSKKKRRKRRKIRFGTDNPMKAKRRAERRERLAMERKESQDLGNIDLLESENSTQSPTKKDLEEGEGAPKKPSLYTYTPFQLLCDNLIRRLIAKHPEEFFAHPVDTDISPDYLDIIDSPMDFSTIQAKVESNSYQHLDEMRHDVEVIVENALLYNHSGTIYYFAAQKLKAVATYYFSLDYVKYLCYSLPFGKEVPRSLVGLKEAGVENSKSNIDGRRANSSRELLSAIADDSNAKEIVNAARNLKSRLASRAPSLPELGYLDNKDGALALNILTGAEKSRLTLGEYVSKLGKGTPGLCRGSTEPRLCVDYPIAPLTHGPYSSFALQYDSTWATLSKKDSDLIGSFHQATDTKAYGSRENEVDASALRQMVRDAGDFLGYVDDYLDLNTDGDHRRVVDMMERKGKRAGSEKLGSLLESVKTLENLGLDLSFLEDLKVQHGITCNETPLNSADQRLRRTGTMIKDLATLQRNRLSSQPPMTLSDQSSNQPSGAEKDLAERIMGELGTSVKEIEAKPEQLVSSHTIHHALGINDDEVDYDVLREFMLV